jgi:hypothetical protein
MDRERGSSAPPEIDGGAAVGLADGDIEHPAIVERAFEQVNRGTRLRAVSADAVGWDR